MENLICLLRMQLDLNLGTSTRNPHTASKAVDVKALAKLSIEAGFLDSVREHPYPHIQGIQVLSDRKMLDHTICSLSFDHLRFGNFVVVLITEKQSKVSIGLFWTWQVQNAVWGWLIVPGPVSSSFGYLWTLMIFMFFNTPTHKSGKQCATNSL